MPRPGKRTRSERRVYRGLPGSNRRLHYERKANAGQHCQLCKKPLSGIPHLSTSEGRTLNRSKRRIMRSYGGQICHSCLKSNLRQAARSIQ